MSSSDKLAPPRHVAIVMDGNGRWAKKRFMPRIFGHKAGMPGGAAADDQDALGVGELVLVFGDATEPKEAF